MKNDLYVMNELNKIAIGYDNCIRENELYSLQYRNKEQLCPKLVINPTRNPYDMVLDFLSVNPQDIKDPSGLEMIINGRMDVEIDE